MQFKPAQGELIGSQLSDTPAGLTPYSKGAGLGWATAPSNVATVIPSLTITSAATLDWSQGGIYQFLCTNGSNAVAFTFTNVTVGQTVFVAIKQASSHTATTLTLPTGSIVAGTAAATQALTATDSVIDFFQITCTASGVYIAVFN